MSYEDRARRRITLWMETHPKVTQRQVAEAAGHLQPWVSRYQKGLVQANLDELAGMASAFGHTLTELLDMRWASAARETLPCCRISARTARCSASVVGGVAIRSGARPAVDPPCLS